MSSLFQGLVDDQGRVRVTADAPDGTTFIFRGIAVRGDGVVHVSTSAAVAGHVASVPVSSEGVVCVETTPTPPDYSIPGGASIVADLLYFGAPLDPDVIHQGVGLRTGGRVCGVIVT